MSLLILYDDIPVVKFSLKHLPVLHDNHLLSLSGSWEKVVIV